MANSFSIDFDSSLFRVGSGGKAACPMRKHSLSWLAIGYFQLPDWVIGSWLIGAKESCPLLAMEMTLINLLDCSLE